MTSKQTVADLLNLEACDEGQVLLIDAGSVIYPSFYAIAGLSTSDGFPTNATFGTTKTLLKLLREHPSRYVGVAFDAPGETFRHRWFSDYKAGRPEMPEDLAVQIPKIKEIIEALGIAIFQAPGFEADDLIATLTRQATDRGIKVLCVTGDKDLMQLVGKTVRILKPGRRPDREIHGLDAAGVREYLGVPPEQVADLLALQGDSTDNVPGVPAVGRKTAVQLLKTFGSLEAVLENADQVKHKRVRDNLITYRDQARLSRALVALEAEVPLGEDPIARCRFSALDRERLKTLFKTLQFRSIPDELGLKDRSDPEPEYMAVLHEADFEGILSRLEGAEEFSFDLETTSEDPLAAEIVGVALAFRPYEGFYVPFDHRYQDAPEQLDRTDVLTKLKPFLEGETKVIGQNLKYDVEVLKRYDIDVSGIAFDAMLASYLLDPTKRSHNLDEISRAYLDHQMLTFKDLFEDGEGEGEAQRFDRVPIDRATQYAAEDAEIVYRLKDRLVSKLHSKDLYELFIQVELPLIEVLAGMELNGIQLDPQILEEQRAGIEAELAALKAEMDELAGRSFNPNSSLQVREILFEELKLPVIERTKTGPSTNARVLNELADQHPLPEKILEYRELSKLLSTYIDKLPGMIRPETGRIHTTFNQSVTATGRLSSVDPNLQNIPIRTEVGRRIRRAFVAPSGRKLLAADYSQIELRLLAYFSADRDLMEAFQTGEDLHTKTAAEIFGVALDEVTSRMRYAAKRVNFGILYGISAYRLSRELGIERDEAQRYIDRFFALYPKVKEFIAHQIATAEKHRYVITILNRRRTLPNITSSNHNLRSYDQRNAVNSPIQGSAADLMKLAMIRIYDRIQSGDLKADLLLQIHDELVFELDEDQVETSSKLIKEIMERVADDNVPLRVDVNVGDHWGEI
ncbi:MAG: DNA polymerase I [Candidatus Bipolaricaulia bacterium]